MLVLCSNTYKRRARRKYGRASWATPVCQSTMHNNDDWKEIVNFRHIIYLFIRLFGPQYRSPHTHTGRPTVVTYRSSNGRSAVELLRMGVERRSIRNRIEVKS